MNKKEEIRLMALAQRDLKFFAPLYEEYFAKIMGFVYRRVLEQAVAEDITSACFVKAISNLHSFEDKGYGVSPWLYKIANNCIIDHYRNPKKETQVITNSQSSALDATTPLTLAIDKEQESEQRTAISTILNKLATMPPEEQFIISLKFFEQKKNTEISRILGCTANSLGVKLHRALDKLRNLCDIPSEVIS